MRPSLTALWCVFKGARPHTHITRSVYCALAHTADETLPPAHTEKFSQFSHMCAQTTSIFVHYALLNSLSLSAPAAGLYSFSTVASPKWRKMARWKSWKTFKALTLLVLLMKFDFNVLFLGFLSFEIEILLLEKASLGFSLFRLQN